MHVVESVANANLTVNADGTLRSRASISGVNAVEFATLSDRIKLAKNGNAGVLLMQEHICMICAFERKTWV